MRVVYIELTEKAPGVAVGFRKATTLDTSVKIHLSSACVLTTKQISSAPPFSSLRVRCKGSLAGQTIRLDGLGPVISEGVLRVKLYGGETVSRLLTVNQSSWTLPRKRSSWRIFTDYVWLGAIHVLGGLDHLLFLFVLLLLVQRPRMLFFTITAFTVSHSITLGLTVLQWLQVSSDAAEACIALSLIFGAWEVSRNKQHISKANIRPGTRDSGPRTLSFVFGLVHGLGFAGSLQAIGLPENAIPLSLLGFNVGVELGQLVFVLPAYFVLVWIRRRSSGWFEEVGVYVVGVSGGYWLWERLVKGLSSQ